MPVVFPRCRFVRKPLVTPLNTLLACFFLQLAVMPVSVRLWGPLHGFLPSQPPLLAVNLATLILCLAFWAFAAGVHFALRPARAMRPPNAGRSHWPLPAALILMFGLTGAAGFAAHYKSLAAFQQFLLAPADFLAQFNRNGAPASWLDVLGDFFAPMLGLALVMAWCRILDRNTRARSNPRAGRSPGRWLAPALLLPIALAFALYGYNRSHFVFPLVAIAAVVGRRAPEAAARYLVLLGTLLAALIVATMIYRFSAHPEDRGTRPNAAVLQTLDTRELLALYAQAPQYLGALLDAGNDGVPPHGGVLSLAGALGQVPVLGRSFRPLSGYALYARATGHPEENPAFAGEIFLDFNVPGVVLAFVAIGALTAWLQQRVLGATRAFEIYVFQLMAIYLCASILLSVEVMAQFAIYSMLPLYLYFVYRMAARRRGRVYR